MLKKSLAPKPGDLVTLSACFALLLLVALPTSDLLDRVDVEANFKIFPRAPVAYSLLGISVAAFLVWTAFSASHVWKRGLAYLCFCGLGLALLLCQTRLVNQVPLGDWPESKLIAFAFDRLDVSPAHLPSADLGFVLVTTFMMTVSFAIVPLVIIGSMLNIQLTMRDQPPRTGGKRGMLAAISLPLVLAAALARFGESWGCIDLISNLMWIPIASAVVTVLVGVPVIILACCRSAVWRWGVFAFWMLPIAACNMLGYVITSLENGWNIDEVFWSALTASIVCFLGALILVAVANKAGFRLVAYRSWEMAGVNRHPRDGSREGRDSLRFSLCGPVIVLLLFSAITVWSSFLDSYHLRIFYLSQPGERFENARLAKLLTRQIERVDGNHRDIGYWDFKFNAKGGLDTVQIQIGGDRSVEVLRRLQEVNVTHVELVGPGRNPSNQLRYPSFSKDHLAALAECKSVTSLSFSGLQFEDMDDSESIRHYPDSCDPDRHYLLRANY